jgi:fumarate reductase flavoprotein subunit
MLSTKSRFLILPFLLLPALAAAQLIPGTYESSAYGEVGKIPVSVTVDQSRIVSIVVGPNQETIGIGREAAQKTAESIVQSQSIDVDVVSGATASSTAVLVAVHESLMAAGADMEQFSSVNRRPVALSTTPMRTDIVVIGGGAAGMVAAIEAAEHGADVILIEKMQFLGGASGICAGDMMVSGSQVQKKLGVTGDSPDLFMKDLLNTGHHLNNKETLDVFSKNLGPTVDWLMQRGVLFDELRGLQSRAEYLTPRILSVRGGCPSLVDTLRRQLRATKTRVLTGTKAQEILVHDGKVMGVAAAGKATEYLISAKSVILATGGYGANKELLQYYLSKALYYGPSSSQGDGHKMAAGVGAKLRLMPFAQTYYDGIEISPGLAKSTLLGNEAALSQGAILIDRSGHRLVNEKGTDREILEAQIRSDGSLFLLMDDASFGAFRKALQGNGVQESEIAAWLEHDSRKPLFMRAETLDALALKAGIPYEALKSTVGRYNRFVSAGKDEDFGRPKQFMLSEIDASGPYYIVEQRPRFAMTIGSVSVNRRLEVLDKNKTPIPNLYAAGEIVNSVHGDEIARGASLSWAAVSGRIAAQSALAEE